MGISVMDEQVPGDWGYLPGLQVDTKVHAGISSSTPILRTSQLKAAQVS